MFDYLYVIITQDFDSGLQIVADFYRRFPRSNL